VCRADVAVWGNAQAETDYDKAEGDRIANDAPNRTEIAKLSLEEIKGRIRELAECRDVDPTGEGSYLDTLRFHHGVQADRWRAFIVRHHLLSQFDREDADGRR